MSEGYFRVPPLRLGDVREALVREGFRSTRFQFRRRGQVFGLVKRLSFMKQLHIRAFSDGTLRAELEAWRFLGPLHLLRDVDLKTARRRLQMILEKYNIRPLKPLK